MSQLQLRYAFVPDPNPIVVSVAGAPASVVNVQVIITNPSLDDLSLREIQVQIPMGAEEARYLSAAPSLPAPVMAAGQGWTATASGSTVTLLAQGGSATVTDTLTLTLPGIVVNDEAGTVQLTLTEYPAGGSKVIDDTTYTLVKNPTTVPVTAFWADPALVTQPDRGTTLYWTCSSQGSAYVYSVHSPSWYPVDCVGAGNCFTCADGASGVNTPMLGETTTFSLDVIATNSQGYREVVQTLQTVVQVEVPYFSPDYWLGQSSTGSGTLARAHWLAFNTAAVTVQVGAQVVSASAPADTLENGFTLALLPQPGTYVVSATARPSTGSARASIGYPAISVRAAPTVAVEGNDGPYAAGPVAVTPDGAWALVLNPPNGALTVFDAPTGVQQSGQVAVPGAPAGIAITPDGTLALLALYDADTMAVMRVPAWALEGAQIPVGSGPQGVAVTPDGRLALVACTVGNAVWVVDVAARQAEPNPIVVGRGPSQVAITPDGQLALVTNSQDASVTVIDIASRSAEPATIPVGRYPGSLAITPDGTLALVSSFGAGTVTVIDIASRRAEPNPLAVGGQAGALAITPDGRYALVTALLEGTGTGQNGVYLIDVAARVVLPQAVPVGAAGGGMAITPDGLLAYVSNWNAGTVSLV